MSREYAGILGLIAFLAMLFRGLLQGGALVGTLQQACVAMIGFAILGFVAGIIGEQIVSDMLKNEIKAEWDELNEQQAAEQNPTGE